MSFDEMQSKGYQVYQGVYTPEESSKLRDAILTKAIDLVFTQQGAEVKDEDQALRLFTDPKLRSSLLQNPNLIWRNGNSRDPIISKSCGMIDIHFDPVVAEMVTFSTRTYDILKKLYGCRCLVHSQGPERVSIKAPGTTDMPKHIDANPFNQEVNFPRRYQALVVAECPTEGPPKRGGLCVLANFHHYFDFFGRMFNPYDGPLEYPDPGSSRFFVLPASPKSESFDGKYLPVLQEYAEMYCDYLYHGIKPKDDDIKAFFKILEKEGIILPKKLPPLEWVAVETEPGDMVVWDQRIPHYSMANTTDTPRIVAYYSVFPVDDEWYGSEEQKWVEEMFTTGRYYYTPNANQYPRTIRNPEEYASVDMKAFRKVVKQSQHGEFLSGQASWYE